MPVLDFTPAPSVSQSNELPGGGYLVNAPVSSIKVPSNRLRELGDTEGLAASIREIGLQSPITLTESGRLVAGWHRLEAVKSLGWETIPAFVVEDDELFNRLIEIDENLERQDLTVWEQSKHVAERERVLEALGQRATKNGSAGRNRPATVAGLSTTGELAKSAGMSERTWQGRTKVGKSLGPQTTAVLDHADKTEEKHRNLLNSTTQLNHLADIANKRGDEVAAEVAELALTTEKGNTFKAYETLKREQNEVERERKREENRARVTESRLPEPGETFSTIALDPPWDWGDEGDVDQLGRAKPTYATMSIDEIEALPVAKLADKNAHIYLWITNRSLPKGFRLLEAWGFRYITCITWVKPSFGMGNYYRGSTEHILFGVRGSLPLERRDLGTHFEAKRPGKHSAKPTEFYDMVESASPGPWLEMFARSERPGWKVWGAEV